MKIYLNTIKDVEHYEFDDVYELNKILNYFQIKKFNNIHASFSITKMESIYELNICLDACIDIVSSYTLKVFPYNFHLEDKLYFTSDENFENDDVIYLENEYFDIDNIIYSLIITSLPLNIHQDNEKIAKIEGVSEDIEDDIASSPFDKLKDIDLD